MIRILATAFTRGALWGAVIATFEAWAIDRRYHVVLEPAVFRVELAVGTALWVGLAATGLVLVREARVRRGVDTGAGARGGDPARRADAAARIAGAAWLSLAVLLHLGAGGGESAARWGGPVTAVAGVVAVVAAAALAGRVSATARGRGIVAAVLSAVVVAAFATGPRSGATGLEPVRGEATPRARPNILMIVTDTERADFLGVYGGHWGASPATDRLAREGTVFERHVAQAGWTLPSTASLLTGQFPSSHGAVATGSRVGASAPMLAEVLHAAGYRTAAFSENFHILPRTGFGRGMEWFEAAWLPWLFDRALVCRLSARLHLPTIVLAPRQAFPDTITHPGQVYWDAARTTSRALAWLKRDDSRPFFAYVHYMGPHGPYGPPEYLLDTPRPDVLVADHPRRKGGGLPLGERGDSVSADALATMRTLYAADIRYVETHMMRLLDWLERTGRARNTIVVLTSDHGEEFYDHGAWNHGGSAYDEVIRVPLVIRAPGVSRPGSRVHAVTRHIDVAPTVLDLVGLPAPTTMQGRSLRPLLEGRPARHVPAYTEVCAIRPPGCRITAVTDSTARLIRVSLGERTVEMVFDLARDAGETHDVSRERPDLADRLLREMALWERAAPIHAGRGESMPIDPATLQRLKSLGYVD